MTAVDWSRIGPHTYEQMIAVLLNTLYPDSYRVDGTGGDGGRDVELDDDGKHVFQLKSHTGRLGSSQRQQIKRSLGRVARLAPSRWTLVVPIDLNPVEIAWFEDLRMNYPFSMDWHGRTWLDRHMSEHPNIANYFLRNGASEAIEILRELREEEQALAQSVPDAVARAEKWIRRVNDLDPFWRFNLTKPVATGGWMVEPVPKYRGAERDRPISIRMEGRFPRTPEGHAARQALDAALSFGRPTTVAAEHITNISVDAPWGVGGHFRGPVSISGPRDDDLNEELLLTATDSAAATRASLPLKLNTGTAGRDGVEMTGRDPTGYLTAQIQILRDGGPGSINFELTVLPGALPGQVAPAARMMAEFQGDNVIELRSADTGEVMFTPTEMKIANPDDFDFMRFILALARIQEYTSIYFPIPETLTSADVAKMHRWHELIEGRTVGVRWSEARASLTITDPGKSANYMTSILSEGNQTLTSVHPYDDYVLGHRMSLPEVTTVYKSIRLRNQAEIERMLPFLPGDKVELVWIPEGDAYAEIRMGQPDNT